MHMIARRPTGSPAQSRSNTQSKPFSLGERAQPGRPQDWRCSSTCAEQQHVAGIDRHPEMLDSPARHDDRLGDDVAPVDDDRGAVHQHHVGAGSDRRGDARREIAGGVGAALLGDQRGAERGEALLGHRAGLVENAFP